MTTLINVPLEDLTKLAFCIQALDDKKTPGLIDKCNRMLIQMLGPHAIKVYAPAENVEPVEKTIARMDIVGDLLSLRSEFSSVSQDSHFAQLINGIIDKVEAL